jgi:tight adherence protein B
VIETLIISAITFIAVAAVAFAVGMLMNDLFGTKESDKPHLDLLPPEPKGGFMARDFFNFIEESGLPMETNVALMMVLGSGLVFMAVPIVVADNFFYAAIAMLVGLMAPLVVFFVIRWWRLRSMRNALPETLQIVADAVRSGYTLQESCEMVVREAKGPLKAEFAHAQHQFQLGHAPLSIMRRMVRRIPLPEFRVFATAVVVHHRAGGNLSLLTERMARVARDRQEVRGHLMAVTAGSRLSAGGMILGSVASMTLLAIIEPDYVGAFVTHPMGPTLLAVACGLMGFGMIWVWRLLKENF